MLLILLKENFKLQVMIEDVQADDATAMEALRTLLRAYAEHLVSVIGPKHICLTAYEAELKNPAGQLLRLAAGKGRRPSGWLCALETHHR